MLKTKKQKLDNPTFFLLPIVGNTEKKLKKNCCKKYKKGKRCSRCPKG